MKAEQLRKLATVLRAAADKAADEKRVRTAKVAVAAVGLDILKRKILSEVV